MNSASQLPDELKNILVVDDEIIVLTALRETLRLEGYHVVATPDALQALEEIRKTRFSVILTDQQMPMLTGLEFLAQAKEVQPDATRILITAVLSLSTVIDAINKGEIYRFIVKPWLREELLVTIRNAVQRYELICGNTQLRQEVQTQNVQLQKEHLAQQNLIRELEQKQRALETEANGTLHLVLKLMAGVDSRLSTRANKALELGRALGRKAQLTPVEQRRLEIAARLHDIGLLDAPRYLLEKWLADPALLDLEETLLMQRHPAWGEEWINSTLGDPELGRLIRSHQERFDGTGYPDRLPGPATPWLARLLAIAAAYAAAPGSGNARDTSIATQSGSAFDPDAVRLFLQVLPELESSNRIRQVQLSELRPGMVLAKGVYNAKGALLLPEGQTLNEPQIQYFKDQLSGLNLGQFVVYG